MAHAPATLWAAAVTLLAGVFYLFTVVRVGVLRGRLNIRAPATSGHPKFERAYRVQMNTLEQMGLLLPFLWVAAFYPPRAYWIPAAIGLLWVIGRMLYSRSYMANPDSRIPWAGLCGACNVALLIFAIMGVSRVWLAGAH